MYASLAQNDCDLKILKINVIEYANLYSGDTTCFSYILSNHYVENKNFNIE